MANLRGGTVLVVQTEQQTYTGGIVPELGFSLRTFKSLTSQLRQIRRKPSWRMILGLTGEASREDNLSAVTVLAMLSTRELLHDLQPLGFRGGGQELGQAS